MKRNIDLMTYLLQCRTRGRTADIPVFLRSHDVVNKL
jgi:hypothetical protein